MICTVVLMVAFSRTSDTSHTKNPEFSWHGLSRMKLVFFLFLVRKLFPRGE